MRGGGEITRLGKTMGGMGQADHMLLNEHLSKCHYNLKKLKCFVYELDVHVFVPKTHFKLLYQLNTNA